MRSGERGFTYLGLLGLLALIGAGLAALGSSWSTALQRERERELQFRGAQIAQAIASYRDAQQPAQWPTDFDSLLDDPRGDGPRHHLRKLYLDPFTGRADWALLPAPQAAAPGQPQGFAGVASRSPQPRLRRALDEPDPPPGSLLRVSDWQFMASPPRDPPRSPASAQDNAP
jgi:type II secretory pathway pseudopilin PulG